MKLRILVINQTTLIPCCLLLAFLLGCQQQSSENENSLPIPNEQTSVLTLELANKLVELPLKCVNQEYPNKLNQVLLDSAAIGTPKTLHPAFYGCFDWHSSVHGHWSMVVLAKKFPELKRRDEVMEILKINLSQENVLAEIEYFNRATEGSFERTYGWAWLLKLAEELHTWEDPMAKVLTQNLQPLTDLIVERYLEFLPKLHYPIRTGEHSTLR